MDARAVLRIVIPLLICLALMGTPAFGATPVDSDDQPAAAVAPAHGVATTPPRR
jgi:hypothetical protein